MIIDWLKEVASVTAVARLLGLTWHEVDVVQRRAVRRGLARRTPKLPKEIGVDETSFHLGGLDLYPAGISGTTHTRP